MNWDIFMYITRVAYLYQVEKFNASSLIQKSKKKDKTKVVLKSHLIIFKYYPAAI